MPVTAKLSRKFYERFGDDIASEFVDWFNAVDTTYQTQTREINELNWERFKSTLQGEGAAIRGELRAEMAQLRTEMEKMGGGLRHEMDGMRADLLKWMFVFWCGTVVGLGGLVVGMAVYGPR